MAHMYTGIYFSSSKSQYFFKLVNLHANSKIDSSRHFFTENMSFYPEYDTDTCLKAVFPSFGQAIDTFKLLKDLPINLGVMETRKLWAMKMIPLKCRFFVSRIEILQILLFSFIV